MATFLDNFTGTAGTAITAHTPDTSPVGSGPWAYRDVPSVHVGSYTIDNTNKLSIAGNNPTGFIVFPNAVGAGAQYYDVTFPVATPSASLVNFSVFGWMDTAQNGGVAVRFTTSSRALDLIYVPNGGTGTTKGTYTVPAGSHTVVLRLRSTGVTVLVDGAVVIGELGLTGAPTPSPHIGVFASTSGTGLNLGVLDSLQADIAQVPTNTTPPAIAWQTGSDPQAAGGVIAVTPGTWGNAPTTQTTKLTRTIAGVTTDIPGASETGVPPLAPFTYTTTSADIGATIQASGTASNSAGSAASPSLSVASLHVTAPPLSAANIHVRHSGGSGNANPLADIGGVMSSTDVPGTTRDADPAVDVSGISQALFDRIIGSVAPLGQTDWRLVYLYNDHASQSAAIVAYLPVQPVEPKLHYAIGLAAEGVNADAAALLSRFTDPPGVTPSAPTTVGAGLAFTLPPLGRIGIWCRRIADPGIPEAATERGSDGNQFAITFDVTPA